MASDEQKIDSHLLRLALLQGRSTWVGALLLGLLLALVAHRGGAGGEVWIWLAALGSLLMLRGLFCWQALRAQAQLHPALVYVYGAFGFAEGAAFISSLFVFRAGSPVDLLLQLTLSFAAAVVTLLPYGVLPRLWLMAALPLFAGQLALLLAAQAPQSDVLVVMWAAVLLACGYASYMHNLRVAGAARARIESERAADAQQQALLDLNSSRDQLRLALDAIDAGVADTNVVTGERFFSVRYTELLGYSDRTNFVRDYRFSESVHPEDRERILAARQSHIEKGSPFRKEFRMRTASGEYVWVQARGESIRDTRGRATRFVMSIVDITKRREAETHLIASERRYRALVDASPSLIFTCDRTGKLTLVSDRACRMIYGFEPRHVLGRHVMAFNAPEFSQMAFLRRFLPVFRGKAVYDVGVVHQTREGESRAVSVSAIPTFDAWGELESVFGICTDVTAQNRRESELAVALRNQQVIFDAAGEGICFVRGGRIENANEALAEMLGVSRQWLTGRPVADIFADVAEWAKVRETTRAASERGESSNQEIMVRAVESGAGSRSVWTQLTASLVGAEGETEAMILVLTDITPLKQREELAWHQANHDELTGLPNRRLLMENARRLLSVAMRRDRLAALMVLDLDGFKDINDVFGHAYGDAMLRRVAMRMSIALREYDLIARTGGDEFVIVLPEIDDLAAARAVAEKLIVAASEEIETNGRLAKMGASIGVAIFPNDAQDFDSLFKRADAAMYQSKQAGKNRYSFASDPAATEVRRAEPQQSTAH
jgi:diguanylate cyclase (GGDEF)-like protein/PAS domain S-box-containing protein